MKTLTYGTVPSFEEFKAAFEGDETIQAMRGYEITLPETSTDYRNLRSAGLLAPERYLSGAIRGYRMVINYSAEQLYRLIENLAELHSIDSDDSFRDWAGDFASSILTTLGFEWL